MNPVLFNGVVLIRNKDPDVFNENVVGQFIVPRPHPWRQCQCSVTKEGVGPARVPVAILLMIIAALAILINTFIPTSCSICSTPAVSSEPGEVLLLSFGIFV